MFISIFRNMLGVDHQEKIVNEVKNQLDKECNETTKSIKKLNGALRHSVTGDIARAIGAIKNGST